MRIIFDFIKDWIILISLGVFLVLGLTYNHFHDPNSAARKLREANIKVCQREFQKSLIIERLISDNARAYRVAAAIDAIRGDKASQANDLATAQSQERDLQAFIALTPIDCTDQYPDIP